MSNESVYSIDSFVEDAKSPPVPKKPPSRPPPSLGVGNSTAPVLNHHQQPAAMQAQNHPPPLRETTRAAYYESSPDTRSNRNPMLRAEHQLRPSFSAEDMSLTSEGSFIITSRNSNPPPTHQMLSAKDRQERFPSFDSMGSSGSFLLQPHRNMPPQSATGFQNQQLPYNHHNAQTNIGHLPYHERRRLMEQKRSSSGSSNESAMVVSVPSQQSQQHLSMSPLQSPQAHHKSHYPMPQSYSPSAHYGGMVGMPPPPPLSSHHQQYGGVPQNFPYGAGAGGYNEYGGGYTDYGPPQQLPPPPPPQPGYHHPSMYAHHHQPPPPRSPTPNSASYSYASASVGDYAANRGFASGQIPAPPSLYSAVPQGPPRYVGNNSHQATMSVDSFDVGGGGAPPPPPPPPPENHPPSSSSLEDSDEYDDSSEEVTTSSEEQEWQREKTERRGNFFSRLFGGGGSQRSANNNTKSQQNQPQPPNVENYHRKNQEFLRRASHEKSRLLGASSPRTPGGKEFPRSSPSAAAQRTPPLSWGSHKRLPSITREEEDDDDDSSADQPQQRSQLQGKLRRGGARPPPRPEDEDRVADERSRLLPPSGISTNEHLDHHHQETFASRRSEQSSSAGEKSFEDDENRNNYWTEEHARQMMKDREALLQQWATAADQKSGKSKLQQHEKSPSWIHSDLNGMVMSVMKFLRWAEAFIANLPLTIGGIALSFANLGVVWFKFTEEMLDSCEPVHFHSSQCSFPEFPGCFYCDKENQIYKLALNFHETCSCIAGILACTFLLKLILARRVVFDELSSPTTATPAGLICMTMDVVFAGRGLVGEVFVLTASSIHLCLAVWFIYMALAYHIMPEPSWFPNTVSIGISAVKTWLYYPMAGHFLMAVSLSLNFLFFPISLIRVAINRKISATVGWMQMSAPSVSLYALTLMAQPSFLEEHPDVTRFQIVHRMVYLPCMHLLFGMAILGMCASLLSLVVRWKEFSKLPFSPAHAAFCAPTLSHANAIQAYRGAVDAFSTVEPGSPLKILLYSYWLTVLVSGTVVMLVIAFRFLTKLPEWTHPDTTDEIEPPQPGETAMIASHLLSTGETLVQPFVSPAILQANETGALVLSRNEDGDQIYRRTRKVTALGFEPIMSELQMDIERELLLEWVARNPPRRRHRTLSVPGIEYYGSDSLGTGNSGVFTGEGSPWNSRRRANTSSPYVSQSRKAQF